MQQMHASSNRNYICFFSVVEHTVIITVITHKPEHFFGQHNNHYFFIFSIVSSLPWMRKNLAQAWAGKE